MSRFSVLEIGVDPLIRDVWLHEDRKDRDVWEGVLGLAPRRTAITSANSILALPQLPA